MRIFHLATRADWEAAQRSGGYTTSTLGRTLAEEGFIHASRADQWRGVRDRFYSGVEEPLVLLVIDTDLLTVPVVEEVPEGGTRTFPHVYGVLDPAAVVEAIDL
jgi:glutathione S-transferase